MDKALFFVRKTWENNWGRDALLHWLGTDLYERDGKAIPPSHSTLTAVQSDLAHQIPKAPSQFDFLTIREIFDEHDIEDELVDNVTRFLLELGKGFSYMGRQFRLEVGQQEFFPDLLFLQCSSSCIRGHRAKSSIFPSIILGAVEFLRFCHQSPVQDRHR